MSNTLNKRTVRKQKQKHPTPLSRRLTFDITVKDVQQAMLRKQLAEALKAETEAEIMTLRLKKEQGLL